MLWGGHEGGLELRKRASGAMALHGRFSYGKRAVLSDGGRTGRPRKEVIAPRAFAYRVDRPEEDIHLLVGHSYDRPLASRGAGTLDISDSDDALTFTAMIHPEMQEVSYVRDALAGIAAGLTLGISPGFRLPPKRAVPEPEMIEDEGHDPENGAHNAIIRTVLAALLYEVSIVTRPAYPEAQVEARSWDLARARPLRSQATAMNRWRV
ncbi:Caudovirus prohead protease [Roseivivax sp. THAF40]|uniref:HK97 family phage prohead protease n=1 Tax=Roseivivax sp. THAF40 TaxID=2587858 RepID=UPI001268F30A|nr:HK97 family phage prohead protease [Roseivivax sp. THAF40]QFT46791.1 Caudovirus prohead protease [Roseivivax sp. THAF40]